MRKNALVLFYRQLYKTDTSLRRESGRFDTKSFRYKSKSIRYTNLVLVPAFFRSFHCN